jgi:hypothetical protein
MKVCVAHAIKACSLRESGIGKGTSGLSRAAQAVNSGSIPSPFGRGRRRRGSAKTEMPGDAIPNFAKSGKIHEESLLEKVWQRVIQICELRKPPEVSGNLRFGRGQPEEIQKHTKTPPNLVL